MTRPGLPPASRPEPAFHPRCAACGSGDIVADAWASWDPEQRCWTLQAVFEHHQCQDCGATTGIGWMPMDRGPEHEEPAR